MIDNFENIKRIAFYIVHVLSKCICKVIDKRILDKLIKELQEICGKA